MLIYSDEWFDFSVLDNSHQSSGSCQGEVILLWMQQTQEELPKSANPSLPPCHQRPAFSQSLTSVIACLELVNNAGLQVPRKPWVTEDLVEMQIPIQQVQGGACDSPFLTSSWVMLTLRSYTTLWGKLYQYPAAPSAPQLTPGHRRDFFLITLFMYYPWLRWAFVAAWAFLWLWWAGSALCRLLTGGLSHGGAQALEHRLRSCGARAYLLLGMWDLPRPGVEPVSLTLAGRFFTTELPGKPQERFFFFFKALPDAFPKCSNIICKMTQRR